MPGEIGQIPRVSPPGKQLLALFVLGFLSLPTVAPAGSAGEGERGLVVRVSDGDTIVVDLHGHEEAVRLIGVDTPELGRRTRAAQPFAIEAAWFARRMVGKKRVLLRPEPARPDRDRYGRLLRYVLLEDGTCLNAELIKRGYGRAMLRYPFSRAREFQALERQARHAQLGIWAAGDSGPRR